MTLAKKIFVSGLIAFWVLMTSHCGWERIPGLKFLACTPLAEAAPHQPSDCGDDDACATVESGNYKSEEGQVSAPKAPILPVAFALALLSDLAALEPPASEISPEATPPELAHVWQFSFRTALPPRAPSFIS
ncbi:MAG: hypothetical protein L0Z50_24760 [Verrucomicrobiales bacterium]|nr:hypothetical protein [Verrucomicrobiales bacterium]